MSIRHTRRAFATGRLCVAAVAVAAGAIGIVRVHRAAASTPPSTSRLVPLAPCRLADQRIHVGYRTVDGSTMRVEVAGRCGVPDDAVAVAVTLTVATAAADGFAAGYPDGGVVPDSSTLNFSAGETRANGAVLQLGSGSLDIRQTTFGGVGVELIVDVNAAFVPVESSSAGRFVPLEPTRLLDTRSGVPNPAGHEVIAPLPASIPPDAVAVAANVTIDRTAAAGFVTVHVPGAPLPDASILNADSSGQTRAAAGVFPVGPEGLAVWTSMRTDVIVDYLGYFTGVSATRSDSGLFVPVAPSRLLDTRHGAPLGPDLPLSRDGGVQVAVPYSASGIAANLTSTDGVGDGFITVYAEGTDEPSTSSLNVVGRRRAAVANQWIGAISADGIELIEHGLALGHAIVDLTGYYTGAPVESNAAMRGCFSTAPIRDATNQLWVAQVGVYQRVVGSASIGPRGPIVVMGDSLTFGSASATATALRAAGWGPVCIDGTVSRTVELGTQDVPDGLDAVARVRSTGAPWTSPSVNWVVALGTNDVTISGTTAALARRYITDQLTAIGPTDEGVSWVQVRTARTGSWPERETVWNAQLAAAGVATQVPWSDDFQAAWVGSDLVHLTSAGVGARVEMITATVSA